MIALLILLGLAAIVILWYFATYNKFIRLRQQVENAWAQIDVQLKRRHDLIPNLVETVKGYAAHERETLTAVTEARAKATSAKTPEESIEAEGELTRALRQLLLVVENYPNLKADQHFLELMEELRNTENLIAFARQAYNDNVMIFNTAIKRIPDAIVASQMKLKEYPFWKIEEEEDREAPQVKF
ncbi:MAG: LemA family protein [Candidatus Aminicenantes bacterium]|nr:LemA family protein [Candidatus Aminicenantes bacterium]